ncbi:MAG: redox-regulated ATPase YchF [Clostridiales Family XIII bacterium]|jgi:GTP-binding protein YchF|nr:redox-regulated ATPase YchF [Clostridiales Family XIII bacterium]
MKLGIVGLPNVGKSALFNAITHAGAETANYPFCTIEPNVGVVAVPDERLDVLHEMFRSKKIIRATVEFYDIAGLVKGASKGEGLGNKFLGHVREAAAIIHTVRCFDDEKVVHVNGAPDPIADIEVVNLELIFSDLELLDRRIEKTRKGLKGDKSLGKELDVLTFLKEGLEAGKPARALDFNDEAFAIAKRLDLLTFKPVIYVANVSEDAAGDFENNAYVSAVRSVAQAEGAGTAVLSAKVEAELAELDEAERAIFMEELGIGESGLNQLIRASYRLLDLISFFTAGEPEARAWTVRRGAKAPEAAGRIHSDFERGFIRAETVDYADLISCGGLSAAREKGLVRSEGKDYVVKDGDVMHFLFNV